jgi:hypothetical protein
MKNYRIKVDKGANAKVVFRGVIVEIKKVNDNEVEIIVPEGARIEELVGYLEKFKVIKVRSPVVESFSEATDTAEQKENNITPDQKDQVNNEQQENESGDQGPSKDNKNEINEKTKEDETDAEDQKQKTSNRKRKR